MSKKSDSQADELRQMQERAQAVIRHHFGNKKPRRTVHKASGHSNYVFAVSHDEGEFVVRASRDPARLNSFIKEQWAQNAARDAGVPVAEILEVGNEITGCPFMISRKIEGREATFHQKRDDILREMGDLARLINTIPTSGFGTTYDWSSNQLSHNENWSEYLEKELQLDERLRTLEKQRIFTSPQLEKIREILESVSGTNPKPKLTHGDLRLKNVIVGDDGKIRSVLDWEHSTSNLAPEWELSIALHDLSIDEKQIFLQGYGLPEKKIIEIAPIIKAINLLNYAPKIERLAEEKDSAQLERYRTRLGGVLDLYSLAK